MPLKTRLNLVRFLEEELITGCSISKILLIPVTISVSIPESHLMVFCSIWDNSKTCALVRHTYSSYLG